MYTSDHLLHVLVCYPINRTTKRVRSYVLTSCAHPCYLLHTLYHTVSKEIHGMHTYSLAQQSIHPSEHLL